MPGEISLREKKKMPIVTAVIGTAIGMVALYVVISHLSGKQVPLVKDDRTAFVALVVVGLVMCAFGIQTTGSSTGYLSIGMFIGGTLGIVILTSFVFALAGKPLPVVDSYRTGFIAVAVLMLVKWGVSTVSLIAGLTR